MAKKKDVIGYCGREGRMARVNLRNGYRDEHVVHCPSCKDKINQAILRNPRTTYVGDTAEEAIRLSNERSTSWW